MTIIVKSYSHPGDQNARLGYLVIDLQVCTISTSFPPSPGLSTHKNNLDRSPPAPWRNDAEMCIDSCVILQMSEKLSEGTGTTSVQPVASNSYNASAPESKETSHEVPGPPEAKKILIPANTVAGMRIVRQKRRRGKCDATMKD